VIEHCQKITPNMQKKSRRYSFDIMGSIKRAMKNFKEKFISHVDQPKSTAPTQSTSKKKEHRHEHAAAPQPGPSESRPKLVDYLPDRRNDNANTRQEQKRLAKENDEAHKNWRHETATWRE
jgi:hypothetical protein